MPRWLAHLLSVLAHPLLLPAYLAYVLLWHAPAGLPLLLAAGARGRALSLVVGLTLGLPALGTYALVRAGRAQSLLLTRRTDRTAPLALALIGFGLAARLFWTWEPLLGVALAAQAGAIAVTGLITRRWLISAHGVGMGGAVGLLLTLAQLAPPDANAAPLVLTLAGILLLAGAVGSARLALAAHSPAQVWAGLGLGLMAGSAPGLWALRMPLPVVP